MLKQAEMNNNSLELRDTINDSGMNRGLNYFYFFLLVLFFVSLTGVQKFPIFILLNKLSGFLLVLTSILTVSRFYVSDVLKVFGIFFIVSLLTSLMVSVDLDKSMDVSKKTFQLLILVIAISQFYIFKGDVKFLVLAIVVNAVVLCFSGNIIAPDQAFSGKIERYSSLTKNSNDFAFQLLLGLVTSLYFWRNNTKFWRIVIIALALMFGYYIAQSGSRKSMAAFFLIIGAWMFFSFRFKVMLRYAVVIFLAILAAGSYLYSFIADSAVMVRFSMLTDDTGGADIRSTLYREAFLLFQGSPFIGVGLDNFREYSVSGLWTHSTYMELLADTGIIGFALFYSTYIMVFKYSNRIKNYFNDDDSLFVSGFMKTILILFLMIGTGSVLFFNIPHWITMAIPIVLYERVMYAVREQDFSEAVVENAEEPGLATE